MKSHHFLLVLFLGMGIFGTTELLAKSPVSKKKTSAPAAPTDPLPEFSEVITMVQQQFAAKADYQPGDLLTSSMVAPLFGKLERMHWKVADRQEILKSILSDGDWLARKLSTRSGRKFMRDIENLPEGYDRVDHFRRMPYGETRLIDMIESPDGYKMIEYMTTTRYGKNLSGMLTVDVNGRNFNKSTGRIYTEIDLLKRLKKSYDAEAVRRLAIESKPKAKTTKKEPETPPTAVSPPSNPPVVNDPFETPAAK